MAIADKTSSAHDIFFIGTEIVPGTCRVSTGLQQITKKGDAKGVDSPSLTVAGLELVTVSIESSSDDESILEQWQDFCEKVNVIVPGKQRTPYECYHPLLDIVQRKKFYVQKIDFKSPRPDEQFVVTVTLIEAPEPKPATSSKTAKKATGSTKPVITSPSGLSSAPSYVPRGGK